MGTVDRGYSYHDDGVLPSQGEYGITYLTLYSSGAGNHYDGWMWDPDRIHYSETERTYGYRNPDYPDYCWDDEVVVDLSNAQTRQESSEFEQGRITSFNTNVSDHPILLQDIDITGLNEEEREAKATTVLFSAIPLVKDAYIHAEVEIQAKMNISPDNTTGTVRMEAFYIINNESDRTMRPNPVDHRAVCTTDERNTFRFLYWNPALNHEDHNYIGVKLLCTGGTAEIGISDNPEYGDAIITLTSAGLVGDHIDEGHPVSLDIYGRSLVPSGYKLKESDYTVLCTYDTGEVYDVSRICTYSPVMGTKIVDPTTTLTAYYQGLSASMTLILAMPESIEMIGVTDFYEDTYELKSEDYVVYAYYETGDVMDISDDEDLVYSPAMGTTINQTTTLTVTYTPSFMPGSSFTDSLVITKHSVVTTGTNNNYPDHLIYTLYDDGYIEITGNANNVDPNENEDYHEIIELPMTIKSSLYYQRPSSIRIKWNASGQIGGIKLIPTSTSSGYAYLTDLINFNNVQIKPHVIRFGNGSYKLSNPIVIQFTSQKFISESKLGFLKNISYDVVDNVPPVITINTVRDVAYGNCNMMFKDCESIHNLDFCSNMDVSRVRIMSEMFSGTGLGASRNDLAGIKNWNVSNVQDMSYMFYGVNGVDFTARDLSLWNPSSVTNANYMFCNSRLKDLIGVGSLTFGSNAVSCSALGMFMNTHIENLNGLGSNFFRKINELRNTFSNNNFLTSLDGIENADFSDVTSLQGTFSSCPYLEDISAISNLDVSNVTNFYNAFGSCLVKNISYFKNWDISSAHNSLAGICPTINKNYQEIQAYLEECSCDVSMWSEYSNTFEDSQIMGIGRRGNVDYLKVYEINISDPDITKRYFATPGIFGNRTTFKVSTNDYNNPIFLNPSAFPAWYRIKMTDYITSGNWGI